MLYWYLGIGYMVLLNEHRKRSFHCTRHGPFRMRMFWRIWGTWPIWFLFFNVPLIVSDFFYIMLFLFQNLKNGDSCDPQLFQKLCTDYQTAKNCTNAGCHFLKQDKENIVTYFEVFNIFGFFWGIWFVSGLSQMILAGAFAGWYWTFNKNNVPFFSVTESAGRTFRYVITQLSAIIFILYFGEISRSKHHF